VRGQREEQRRRAADHERLRGHNDEQGHGSGRGAAEWAGEEGQRVVAAAWVGSDPDADLVWVKWGTHVT
jgi:hypothetical protein